MSPKNQRLLAGAAMHVAEHVDGRGHGAVDADAAGRGHAGDGDRRRLRPVIDRGHQRVPSSSACASVGSSPRSISQIIAGKLTAPISSSIG